jgi:hypothetical protein
MGGHVRIGEKGTFAIILYSVPLIWNIIRKVSGVIAAREAHRPVQTQNLDT